MKKRADRGSVRLSLVWAGAVVFLAAELFACSATPPLLSINHTAKPYSSGAVTTR